MKEKKKIMFLTGDGINCERRMPSCRPQEPTRGHQIIAALEAEFDVTVITQNGGDYHQRAGSKNVMYLHSEDINSDVWWQALKATDKADWFVLVGSPLFVRSAVSLLAALPAKTHLVIIDPKEVTLPPQCYHGYTYIPEPADEGLYHFVEMLARYERCNKWLENYLRNGTVGAGCF